MFVRAKSYRLFRRIDTRADITGKSRREREMPLAFLNGPGDSETIGAAKRTPFLLRSSASLHRGRGEWIFEICRRPIPRIDSVEPSNDSLLELCAAVYLLSGRRGRHAAG